MASVSPESRQAIRRALCCLRHDLLPGLSPRQKQTAARLEASLREALGESDPAPSDGDAGSLAPPRDPLQAALSRLDDCIAGQLRRGRLNAEARRVLSRELARTARALHVEHTASAA